MFTLKFFPVMQNAGIPRYRCIAAKEFEVGPAPDAPGGTLSVLISPLDGSSPFEWEIRPGEYCIVENFTGKTIDKLQCVPMQQKVPMRAD